MAMIFGGFAVAAAGFSIFFHLYKAPRALVAGARARSFGGLGMPNQQTMITASTLRDCVDSTVFTGAPLTYWTQAVIRVAMFASRCVLM